MFVIFRHFGGNFGQYHPHVDLDLLHLGVEVCGIRYFGVNTATTIPSITHKLPQILLYSCPCLLVIECTTIKWQEGYHCIVLRIYTCLSSMLNNYCSKVHCAQEDKDGCMWVQTQLPSVGTSMLKYLGMCCTNELVFLKKSYTWVLFLSKNPQK